MLNKPIIYSLAIPYDLEFEISQLTGLEEFGMWKMLLP